MIIISVLTFNGSVRNKGQNTAGSLRRAVLSLNLEGVLTKWSDWRLFFFSCCKEVWSAFKAKSDAVMISIGRREKDPRPPQKFYSVYIYSIIVNLNQHCCDISDKIRAQKIKLMLAICPSDKRRRLSSHSLLLASWLWSFWVHLSPTAVI